MPRYQTPGIQLLLLHPVVKGKTGFANQQPMLAGLVKHHLIGRFIMQYQ